MRYDGSYLGFSLYESGGESFFGPRMARAIVIRGIEDDEKYFGDLACSFEELKRDFPEAFQEATNYLRLWIAEIEEDRIPRKPVASQQIPLPLWGRGQNKKAC
jgi:hypothetical protein